MEPADRDQDQFGFHALEHASCPSGTGWGVAMMAGEDGVVACAGCGYRADTPLTGTLADCFDLMHRQWGLRGDPHVWRMLRERLSDLPTPPDVEGTLRRAFSDATGIDVSAEEAAHVYLEDHDHGGMSGGMVDLGWWRTKGFPLMVARATGRNQ